MSISAQVGPVFSVGRMFEILATRRNKVHLKKKGTETDPTIPTGHTSTECSDCSYRNDQSC